MSHATSSSLSAAATTKRHPPRPVLVAGIMPRSGTNFLHRLLALHPDCAPLGHPPVREDFLLHHADALVDYADRLAWHWGHWGEAAPSRDALLQALGDGLRHFFVSDRPGAARVVTKTPSVRNVERFFDLFADGTLVVVIRDGRSVVASGMEGFGWPFEASVRRWAAAARAVLTLQEEQGAASARHLILRYEDLNRAPVPTLTAVLRLLDLEPEAYDFPAALDLPVYGSSFVQPDDAVTWTPQSKPSDFDREERWAAWTADMHARFNWLAGRELAALGYAPVRPAEPSALAPLRQRGRDLRYDLSRTPRRLLQASRAAAHSFFRALHAPTH
jgi:hypothetical protein